jgi:hypothetical protein
LILAPQGTIIGGLSGLAFGSWISIGMNFSGAIKKTPWLPPAPSDNCPVDSFINETSSWLIRNGNNTDFYDNYTTTAATIVTSTVATVREV